MSWNNLETHKVGKILPTFFSFYATNFISSSNALKPFSRSAMMSSICSVPIDSLMVLSEIPA